MNMTKPFLILLGILIFFNSCKENESLKTKSPGTEEFLEIKKEQSNQASIEESYIQNDSLTNVLINKLKNTSSNSRFIIDKKPIKNKHVENLIDTIITYSLKDTFITSYKTIDKEFICKAKIKSSDFELTDYIKVGTKKYVVEKSLAKGIIGNILKIGSSEGTLEFILKFEGGTLKTIEFEGFID